MQENNSKNKGNEFLEVVQKAIHTGDYHELSDKVKDVVNVTADEIRNIKDDFLDSFLGNSTSRTVSKTNTTSKSKKSYYEQSQWKSTVQTNYNVRPEVRRNTAITLYVKRPKGKVAGFFKMLLGFGFAPVAIMFLLKVMGNLLAMVVFSALLGGSVAFGLTGMHRWQFVKRFQEYVRIVGNRGYCAIEELEVRTNRKKTTIVKDLRRMIEQKLFLQGHLDQKETCLIVTDDMYKQYLEVEQQARERELLQQAEQAKLEQLPEACRTILEEGKSYISFIKDCNDKLPGEVISMKLDRLELIITRIFAEVEAKPELAGDLRRFMNYYLPTTKKLVQAYLDLEQEPISSDSMTKTKKEIEDTLDTINLAFENLLNSFFDTRALDISSDISALNTMLAQEGLTKRDFEIK